jgi:hypothetical protein
MYGFSVPGWPSNSFRNPLGLGVCVSVASPAWLKRRAQQPGRNANRFQDIVILADLAVERSAARAEDDDQPRRDVEKRLGGIGADGSQRVEPFDACLARLKFALLGLGGGAEARAHVWVIADHREMPRW